MIGGVNVATSQIANIYNQGNNQLSDTLAKIASGKKFQNAGEDLLSFTRANNLSNQIKGYNDVEQKLTDAKTVTSAAVNVGSKVYENLTKMSDLAGKYAAASATEQAEYTAEFNSLKDTVVKSLENAKVDGVSITSGTYTRTVNMDPNGSTMSIALDTVVDSAAVDALAIGTAGADLTTQTGNALTFMADAKGFNDMIDNQISLNKTIVNSKEAVKSLITDIDEASEMSKMLDQNVRQQAAMSMLSQANMSRQVVMKLY
ncbi:MAG: flagellin [Fibrobacterota bacterium]|nr:flagellin [Chitinispirillaceae bacterium]